MSFTGLRTFIPAEEVSFGTVSFYTRGRQPSTKSGTDSKPPPDSYIPFWTDPRPGRKLFIVSNFSGRSRDFVYQLPLRGRGSPVRFYSAPGTSCTSSHCGDAGALLVSTQPQLSCLRRGESGTDSKPPPDSYIPFWTDPRPGRKLFIVSNFSGRSRDFVYQLPVWGRGSPVRFYSAPGTSCTSSHCGDAGALFVFTQPQGLCDPAPLSGTREPLTKFSEHPELWINPPSVSSNFSPAAAGEK